MVFDFHTDIWADVLHRRKRGEEDVLRRCHLPRLRQGGLEGAVFSLWMDTADPMQETKDMMAAARAELAECSEVRLVHTCAEMERSRAEGVFYIWQGVEGMAAIGEDLALIDWYYDFGARTAMLTWNEENALATGAGGSADRGLTALGRQAVRRMQDKKMLLDVSHLNDRSFWDLMGMATAPVCASHSNARGLCPARRNLTDEQLRAIRDLDGVVGLNAHAGFVAENREGQTVEALARHAAHMIDVMGIEHVGCGFDFCEFIEVPGSRTDIYTQGLENAAWVPNLFAEFTKMGMTADEQEKIARGNFQALLQKTVG